MDFCVHGDAATASRPTRRAGVAVGFCLMDIHRGTESMSWVSSEVVGVLTFLLPGFVAAAIFYSLTSHPKPSAFDRVVLALIFTVVGQAIVAALLAIDDTTRDIRQWIRDWELFSSVIVATALGLIASYASNTDTVHGILRFVASPERPPIRPNGIPLSRDIMAATSCCT